jgi:hypothetical protein
LYELEKELDAGEPSDVPVNPDVAELYAGEFEDKKEKPDGQELHTGEPPSAVPKNQKLDNLAKLLAFKYGEEPRRCNKFTIAGEKPDGKELDKGGKELDAGERADEPGDRDLAELLACTIGDKKEKPGGQEPDGQVGEQDGKRVDKKDKKDKKDKQEAKMENKKDKDKLKGGKRTKAEKNKDQEARDKDGNACPRAFCLRNHYELGNSFAPGFFKYGTSENHDCKLWVLHHRGSSKQQRNLKKPRRHNIQRLKLRIWEMDP